MMTQNLLKGRLALAGTSLAVLVGCAAPQAQVPDYFYDMAVGTVLAQSIATSCPTLEFNEAHQPVALAEMEARFAADGFTNAQIEAMPSLVDASVVRGQIDAFNARHGLIGAGPDAHCAAGRAEIFAGSQTGKFLKGGGQ